MQEKRAGNLALAKLSHSFPTSQIRITKYTPMGLVIFELNERKSEKGSVHSGTQLELHTQQLLNSLEHLTGLRAKAKSLGNLRRKETLGLQQGGMHNFKGFTKTGLA